MRRRDGEARSREGEESGEVGGGPGWERIAGTIVLAGALSIVMLRGMLRDDEIPAEIALAGVATMVVFACRFWPSLVFLWEGKLPFALTWRRLALLAAAAVLLTGVVVVGGQGFGVALDPWLVLAFIVLAALMSCAGEWHDPTIRWSERAQGIPHRKSGVSRSG